MGSLAMKFIGEDCVYDKVREVLLSKKVSVLVIDFELAYTAEYLDYVKNKLIQDSTVFKHFIPRFHCKHSFDWSDDVHDFRPQWILGFKSANCEFFASNVGEYRSASERFMREVLREAILDKGLVLAGQNLLFDAIILAEILELTPSEVLQMKLDDLMTASFTLNTTDKRRSLDVLADRYLEKVGDKYITGRVGDAYEYVDAVWKHDEDWHRTKLDARFEETVAYNLEDLRITWALYRKLSSMIRRNRQESALRLYRWFISFYAQLEMNGLYIDTSRAEDVVFSRIDEAFKARRRIMENAVKLVDLMKTRHPDKKASVLKAYAKLPDKYKAKFKFFDFENFKFRGEDCVDNDKLKFSDILSLATVSGSNFREFISFLLVEGFQTSLMTKTAKGAYSFKQDEIENVKSALEGGQEETDQVLKRLLEDQLTVNSLNANLARLKAFQILPSVYRSGRLHHEYKLTGTKTGRLSSVRPGVMNMPQQIKDLVIAQREGGKIGQIDLKSAEAKLFMMIIQNRDVLMKLKTNPDTYSVIGTEVFETPITKKDRPVERAIMKGAVLANMYGQSIYGLAEQVEKLYTAHLHEIALDAVEHKVSNSEKKYKFLHEWKCLENFDCESAISLHKEYLAKKAEAQERGASEDTLRAIDEQHRVKMASLVQVDYLKLASISKERLDHLISAQVYEEWINRTFFRIDDPPNSYVESLVKTRRIFDHSRRGLLRSSGAAASAAYALILQVYWAFLKEFKVFQYNGMRLKSLHAFSQLAWKLRSARNYGNTEQVLSRLSHLFDFVEKEKSKYVTEVAESRYFRQREGLLELALTPFRELALKVLQNSKSYEHFVKGARKLMAAYREALNNPVQGTSSFFNSYLGKKLYEASIEAGIDVKVINTVHDAVQFEIYDKFEEFEKVAERIYEDIGLLRDLLEDGLKSIHPDMDPSEFVYLPIGGEFEIRDSLGETK